ncbi:transglutaminase-like domain-containing protein [Stomatobaculum longum]|uniref:transglutaminase-like domain-containing protein n=1 Tax=Stomatobaculum longum TaxID=796942 RepID=UPI0028EFEA86|nr:transglutaminase domain-containing protein [Stomatobaculum longum]
MGKNIFESMYLPLPSPVQQMKERGNLEEAEAYLQHLLETGECLPEERRRFRAELEILRRLPAEYPYTRAEALELVRRYVPNFSEADFDSLLMKGKLFWRFLDGEARFFGRFFDSLCKTDSFFAEAAAKQGHCIPGSDRRLLEESAEKMRAQGELSVRITVRAELELEEAFFREGALIRAYLPLPRVTEEQIDIALEEMSAGGQLGAGSAAQRVVFWEERLGENHPFIVSYRFLHTERYRDAYGLAERMQAEGRAEKQSENEITKYGAEKRAESGYDSALFPPSAYLRSLADELTAGVTEPLVKAKCFYDFITKKVRYSFMPSYFCLDRMAERCAMDRVGDCGIQALLFLSLCEAVGIPARWESGLKTEPKFIGAHDWVRFFTPSFGWRAADLSYGGSAWKRGDELLHRFYFGNVDPWRMAANARILGETGFPEPEFRADPYDNQVGEMALDGRGLRYEEFRRRKEVLRAEEIRQVIRP